MDLIADTNALSAIAGGDPDIVLAVEAATSVSIPVIVLGEYRFGIAQSRYRVRHETWLDTNLLGYRTLDVSEMTARHYAAIRLELKRAGTPIPTNDLWIAALASTPSRFSAATATSIV